MWIVFKYRQSQKVKVPRRGKEEEKKRKVREVRKTRRVHNKSKLLHIVKVPESVLCRGGGALGWPMGSSGVASKARRVAPDW